MGSYSNNGYYSRNTSTSFDALLLLKAWKLLSVVSSNAIFNITEYRFSSPTPILNLLQISGKTFLRTVRKFFGGSPEGEIPLVNWVFKAKILIFTFSLPCKYLGNAIDLPYFFLNSEILPKFLFFPKI
jgi:hypothetical protein